MLSTSSSSSSSSSPSSFHFPVVSRHVLDPSREPTASARSRHYSFSLFQPRQGPSRTLTMAKKKSHMPNRGTRQAQGSLRATNKHHQPGRVVELCAVCDPPATCRSRVARVQPPGRDTERSGPIDSITPPGRYTARSWEHWWEKEGGERTIAVKPGHVLHVLHDTAPCLHHNWFNMGANWNPSHAPCISGKWLKAGNERKWKIRQ